MQDSPQTHDQQTLRLRGRRTLGWQTLILTMSMAALLFLMGLRNHTLWDYHEPYVGGIIREMATSGDWIVPTLNGQPFLEKPPLFYALGAICCRLVGTFDPWVIRLPTALMAMATVVWASYLGWRLSSARAGAWAGFLVATSALFFMEGHMAVVDMTLTTTASLSLGLAFLVIVEPPYRTRWQPWFWASLGLTFLAKGIFGPVLVLIPLGAFCWYRRDRQLASEIFRPNWGMVVAALLVLAWVVPLASRGGMNFLIEVFLRNSIGRFLASPDLVSRTGRLREHVEPFYFYLARTPGNLLPWLVIWGGGMAWSLPRRGRPHLAPRHTFLPFVFGLDLLLLSLSQAKRMVYLLPVLPITFVHAALWLDLKMPKRRARAPRPVFYVLAITLLLVGILGAVLPWIVAARAHMDRGLAAGLTLLSFALSSMAIVLLRQRRFPLVLDWMMVQWTIVLLVFIIFGVPELDRQWRPILEPFRIAHALENRGCTVLEGRLSETQLGYASLEFRHTLPAASTPAVVQSVLMSPNPMVLLLETKHYWRKQLRYILKNVVETPTEASRSDLLWDRAPTLVMNEPAYRILIMQRPEMTGAGPVVLRPNE